MALTLVQRPECRNLKPETIMASFSATASDSSGDALFTHGSFLRDDEWCYMVGFIDDYNGFFEVDVISATTFKIKDQWGQYVPFINTGTVTVTRSSTSNGANSVYTPIIYKFTSNRFPTNSVDTARTVSSYSNDNGYVNLNLSGSLGTFNELQFIQISGGTDTRVNGFFQVLDKVSNSDVTIDLAYLTTYSFSGASVILYYSNYSAVIEVYAGFNSYHYWFGLKPFELVATLNVIPDSNNRVEFSINEILKGYLNTLNSHTLGTLPNNLDMCIGFYIKYGESYDQSDGYTLTTFESSLSPDDTTRLPDLFAINSFLPFRNMYAGWMNEYLMDGINTGKFLTRFARPVLFDTNSFSISWANFITDYYNFDAGVALQWIAGTVGGGANWGLTPAQVTLTSGSPNSNGLYVANDLIVDYRAEVSIEISGTFTGTVVVWFGSANVNGQGGVFPPVQLVSSAVPTTFVGAFEYGAAEESFRFFVTSNVSSGSAVVTVNSFKLKPNDYLVRTKKYLNGVLVTTTEDQIPYMDQGIYRHFIDHDPNYDQFVVSVLDGASTTAYSEELTIDINNDCNEFSIILEWLNNLGGFDQWMFTSFKDNIVDVRGAGETKKNIFNNYPKSYGSFADTITKQTFRDSNESVLVRCQYVTQEQLDGIALIKSSVLVQQVNSRIDKRTVIIDTDSFTKYADGDKTFTIQFSFKYTDDIPSQRA